MEKRSRSRKTVKLIASNDTKNGNSSFCPVCQIPFKLLKIAPISHVSKCFILSWDDTEECKEGKNCENIDVFHYRDYSHKLLAEYRASNQSPNDSFAKSDSRLENSKIDDEITANGDKISSADEDTDIFLPSTKRIKKRSNLKQKQQVQRKIKASGADENKRKIEPEINVSNVVDECDVTPLAIREYEDNTNMNCNKFTTVENFENCDVEDSKKESCILEWKTIFKKSGLSSIGSIIEKNKRRKEPKHCPYYKKVSGTPFAVDAFDCGDIPGVTKYFLTHFHADHYKGLTKSFSHVLYCTQITADLVQLKLNVKKDNIRVLQCKVPSLIDNILVTPLEANHCPGAVIILFRLPNGEEHLHTGDFRATCEMENEAFLKEAVITFLYLDTTYFNSRYEFPTQTEVISRVRKIVKEKLKLHKRPLFVCGSYTIGKEKVFMGIVDELKCNIWAEKTKLKVLQCLGDKSIISAYTSDESNAIVHVLPMNRLNFEFLKQYLLDFQGSFSHIFAFKPTGWEMKVNAIDYINSYTNGNVTIYGVPYSEHSSFSELCRFIKFIKPKKVIPTVNRSNREMYTKLKEITSNPCSRTIQNTMDKYIST